LSEGLKSWLQLGKGLIDSLSLLIMGDLGSLVESASPVFFSSMGSIDSEVALACVLQASSVSLSPEAIFNT